MADYEMYKGETFVLNSVIKEADGRAKNLTGALVYFTVKNLVNEPDLNAVFQGYSPAHGVIITSALLGLATSTMPPISTYALQGDSDIILVYDVKVIDAAGLQSVAETGTLTVHPAITRAIS